MLILYKDGQESPPLYSVDARQWELAGWTSDGTTVAAVQSDWSLSDLQELYDSEGWSAIKEIADSLGIQKPKDGWEAAIPLIASGR
jgi:hypothetical protein